MEPAERPGASCESRRRRHVAARDPTPRRRSRPGRCRPQRLSPSRPQPPAAGDAARRWRWALIARRRRSPSSCSLGGALVGLALLRRGRSFPTTRTGPKTSRSRRSRRGRIVLERTEETEPPGRLRPDLAGRARDRRAGPGERRGHGHPPAGRRRTAIWCPNARSAIDSYVYAGEPAQRPRPSVQVGARSTASSARCRPGWCPEQGGEATWAIVVHGINSNPQDGLRAGARSCAASGLPALLHHLPRGPRRPREPRRLPPHGADRVARPRGGGALRARPRRPAAWS